MSQATNYLETALFNLSLRNTAYAPAATIYLRLLSGASTEAGSQANEIAVGAYAGTAITFGAAASGVILQSADVTFPVATASYTVSHWAIGDAAAAGNYLAYGTFATPRTVAIGSAFRLPSGQLSLTLDSGAITYFLANALLNHTFRNSVYVRPATVYAGLSLATPGKSGSLSNEVTTVGTAYARQSMAFAAPTDGVGANSADVTFPTATANYGKVTHRFIADGGTAGAGNVMFYTTVPGGSYNDVKTGDYVKIYAAQLSLGIA